MPNRFVSTIVKHPVRRGLLVQSSLRTPRCKFCCRKTQNSTGDVFGGSYRKSAFSLVGILCSVFIFRVTNTGPGQTPPYKQEARVIRPVTSTVRFLKIVSFSSSSAQISSTRWWSATSRSGSPSPSPPRTTQHTRAAALWSLRSRWPTTSPPKATRTLPPTRAVTIVDEFMQCALWNGILHPSYFS